jgi:hypothetical protein
MKGGDASRDCIQLIVILLVGEIYAKRRIKTMESESKNSQFFYCYDKSLKNFLVYNGLRYITKAISIKDNLVFYLFFQTDELTKLLAEFKRIQKMQIN